MADYSHVGDYGTALKVTITEDGSAVNLSNATVQEILLEKPSGEVITYDASHTNDGADGKIEATTQEGDLDESGEYTIQGHVKLPNGRWFTSRDHLVVNPTLGQ